ncbi:MAG TPA: RNase H family protein [Pyrinomonadaceae bacterium]|nr:RNase H family protein [Pyrinomonadaceae bacterium]
MRDEKKTKGEDSLKGKAKAETPGETEDLIHPSSLIPHPLKSVTIYCDGSSLGNGQAEPRAAAVALLNFRDQWRAFGCYLGTATNQQAEIAAAAVGLEQLREPCRVRVLTDSRYVVETMAGRFRRKSNHEWWARLDKALAAHSIEWEWIKGHAGHNAQEAVDKAARRIAALGRVDESVLREAAETLSSPAAS